MDENSSARLPGLTQVPAIVDQHTVGTAELLLVASIFPLPHGWDMDGIWLGYGWDMG